VYPPRHTKRVEQSRQEILRVVGEVEDLVFVRGIGNLGDELIWAGVRALLGDRPFREVSVEELPGTSGHTALICGGGAFCHPFHEFMPQVLAVAEMRFERVVVLPSTFDTSVDVVREALRRTRAVVFARERESYGLIQSLCDARLAHDTSFFFDYEPYRQAGSGVLHAFRTDAEAAGGRPLPPDNDDISATAGTLEQWLGTVARHAVVRTDRAHVMIAAALLGKEVEFAESSYFKVPAIADYALEGFPVRRLASMAAPPTLTRLAPVPCSAEAGVAQARLQARARDVPPPALGRVRSSGGAPRVTAVVASHNRPQLVLGTLHSLLEVTSVPVDVLVVDNNSAPGTRVVLGDVCSEEPRIRLHLSERNLGCAGASQLALGLLGTELVLFLDDDAELLPGALEHMVSELDLHPDVGAVTATVVLPDGRVSHSGGRFSESREIVDFTLGSSGIQFDDPGLPASGPCDWVPGTAFLARTSLFADFPIETGMAAYYEDNEWSYRITRVRPGCFRRSRDAVVLHHAMPRPWGSRDFIGRAAQVRYISAAAHFYHAHGRLLGVPGVDLFTIMPELVRRDGTRGLAATRLLMALVRAQGTDWLLMEWMNGGLAPLLGVERNALAGELESSRTEATALRTELGAARSDLDAAHSQLEVERREREDAAARLQRIYASRLWRLGGTYDRARQRARRLARSLPRGARPPIR
jgi:GT2 family glycosyltransferase